MPKRIVLYKCRWCNRMTPTTKDNIETHEKYCFKNPKNKACLSCVSFKRRFLTDEERDHFRGYVYECPKLDIKSTCTMSSRFNFRLSTGEKIGEFNYVFDSGECELKFPTKQCKDYKRKPNKK